MEWNSKNCLLHRYYSGDQALTDCRNSNVQFDLVFGEFSDWPYYPDQLMTIYRCGRPGQPSHVTTKHLPAC